MYVTPKSGAFLALSCVAAIAAVGSIFELSSGTPQLGVTTTSIILAVTTPLTALLFYVAIQTAKSSQ